MRTKRIVRYPMSRDLNPLCFSMQYANHRVFIQARQNWPCHEASAS